MNRFIKALILLLALFSFCRTFADTTFLNKKRGYEPFTYATKEGILIENPTDSLVYDYYALAKPATTFALDFRSKNITGNPASKYSYTTRKGKEVIIKNPHWGFFIRTSSDTLGVTVKTVDKKTAVELQSALEISIYSGKLKRKESKIISENVNPYNGDNLWSLNINDGVCKIKAGNTRLNEIMDFPVEGKVLGVGFYAGWGSKILISDIKMTAIYEDSGKVTDTSFEEIESRVGKSEDDMEGYWTIFDRDLEESLLKFGGNYKFLCFKDGEEYKLIYLEGASVNSREWKKGDVKAILRPTPFSGIYDVEWLDSMKQPLSHEIKAQQGEGNTLLFQFPYQSSKFRLRKIP